MSSQYPSAIHPVLHPAVVDPPVVQVVPWEVVKPPVVDATVVVEFPPLPPLGSRHEKFVKKIHHNIRQKSRQKNCQKKSSKFRQKNSSKNSSKNWSCAKETFQKNFKKDYILVWVRNKVRRPKISKLSNNHRNCRSIQWNVERFRF